MPFNFYDTHTLLMAVQSIESAPSFLKDRYFPNGEVFSTTDVLAEYRDGSKKLAPFVAPRKGGVTIARQGYTMERYTPPTIKPKRMLTIDDITKRGFGEALYSQMSPEQRQQVFLLRDAEELGNLITRREEAMAAETLLNNGCVMNHISDDVEKGEEMEVRFYTEGANPATYTPSANWSESSTTILDDIGAMIRMLTSRGLPATDLVVSSDVADVLLANATIQKLMDIRNYNLGEVAPITLPAGAARVARINVKGRMIDVISYDETYTNDAGVDTPYLPAGTAIVTAPACGRTIYGAVSQVEQSDGQFHTYTGTRVPKYVASAEGNTRSLTITSSPLLVPNNKNPFVSAKVITA